MATISQVYKTKVQNIDKLKLTLIHVWRNLEQSVIDDAITLLTNGVCDLVNVSMQRGTFWTFCVIVMEKTENRLFRSVIIDILLFSVQVVMYG